MSSLPRLPHICYLIHLNLVLSTLFRWGYLIESALVKVPNNLHDDRPRVNSSVFISPELRASYNTEAHSFLLDTFPILACVKPHGPGFSSSLLVTSLTCWILLYRISKYLQDLVPHPLFFWIFSYSLIVSFILMALNITYSLIIPKFVSLVQPSSFNSKPTCFQVDFIFLVV